ncbi:MAG: hypothetical protein RI883_686 [Bacteroidota bacterium]
MAIEIKEPCSEDWSKMTTTEKGAFCQKCALEVVDFTNKTAFEIKQTLIDEFSKSPRLCGHITNYQLNQINDEFFKWKNERETFRAIWIFSLLAVFGFTLFSCQNTLSKEMISKLNAETSVLLESDTTKTEVTLLGSTVEDPDSLAIKIGDIPYLKLPYEEVITLSGVVPYSPFDFKISPWEICIVSLGSIAISGLIQPSTDTVNFLKATNNVLVHPNLGLTLIKQNPANKPTQKIERNTIEAVLGSSEKKFDAFIYPNPLTPESRVFIKAHESLILFVDVFRTSENDAFRSGSIELATGNHQLDVKLYDFSKGNYQLNLQASNQLSVLDFTV